MKTRLAQASRSYLSRMLRKGVFVLLVHLCLGIVAARAQNASWLFSPESSDWNAAANWAPATVPTGTATFGASNTTTITFSGLHTSVGTLHFKAGAPAYSFNLSDFDLKITGTGIVNNSSNRPTFSNTNGGGTEFVNTSTAGTATITTNIGALTFFYDSSTAGTATITTNLEAATVFVNTSTAGDATIITNNRGATDFLNTSTAGTATITTNDGGGTFFNDSSTGGQARFITNAAGIFDISSLSSGGMTAGSIEGAGTYRLGSKALTVGLNNLSTEVSGSVVGMGGALIKVGTGTLTLTGTNTYSGGTDINGGILAVNSDANLGAAPLSLGTGPLSFNGGTLEALGAGGGITSSKAITLNAGGGTFLADAGTTSTLNGAISGVGSLTKDGLGTLALTVALTGTSTYGGDTIVKGGTLSIQSGGTVSDANGFIGDAGSTGTATVTGAGSTWTNKGALFVGGNSGGPGGVGLLQISNDGTVNAAATTIWNTGTLAIGGSFTLNSPLSNNGGTVRTVADATFPNNATLGAGGAIFDSNGFNSVLSGAYTGSGGITKINAGTVTLTGANTYSGDTVINDGTLLVNNSEALGLGDVVVNGGVLGADAKPTNVKGNYTQNAGGTLQLQVAGANPGQYDSLNVGGNATLGGTLQLISLAFQPKAGNQLTLVTTGGVVSGRFAQFVYPFATGPGFNTVELVYGPNSVLLEFLK